MSVAAFFDVDNTIMRGASAFHFAVGLARHRYFTAPQIWRFGIKQAAFVIRGKESSRHMASATSAALEFVAGRPVTELLAISDEVFDEVLAAKILPGPIALAQAHIARGEQVWLVTATPVELAELLARRLGLTGGLGTVAEVVDGRYTGRLVGPALHGPAKAAAVRELAERTGIDLARSWAYSDSINDLPLLSEVGHPVAVNADGRLRAHARESDWPIKDFRSRQVLREQALPALITAGGFLGGAVAGYALGRQVSRTPRG